MTDAALDTTFFIDLRRGDSGAESVWASISNGDLTASFSAVIALELWLGNQLPGEEEFYEAMFTLLTEANLTASAAKQAGLWLPDLPGATAQRLIHDALVAAVALERGEVVYTRNRRDLGRFPVKIEGY